ncbi:concanavalin A-like lectin/glucanase [Piromyces finnis]|uniref:Endo-1,4-beta-xylanase n=1 Tax=Piromyces finnis TaxID=1754191 RepID=A0A1Y1USD0_9FUNG|nr:concanavalin A-like lectin/glucanase [Piromyces finnis]|eukprot:ORX40356.1 concanavalin A-like lectin/glucanase [Piromyces finnis]
MKFVTLTSILSLATSLVAGQSFCSGSSHSGQSVKVTSNKVGTIGSVGYELWADSGNNSATFYSDGSFSCTFQNAKDYLCRTGLSFDSTKTHDQLGHMYADFKLVKQNIQNVDYSYVGIYGWSRNPLVEYYIVDNWLSQWRPGDWVGNKKHGDFVIDGATYTVYENTRYGPSIDGDTQFKQFFSIRQQARDCGTIDITAHFQQWEKLGMKLGKMHEAKVLGEAGSTGSGTSGTADFPYAKVYIGSGNSNAGNSSAKTLPVSSSAKTLPVSSSAKTLPVTSSGKTLPVTSSGKTLPVTSSGKTLPLLPLVRPSQLLPLVRPSHHFLW